MQEMLEGDGEHAQPHYLADPWTDRMGRYLAAFTADPEGETTISTRELVELARSARDLEALVAAAPSTHYARLFRAAELMDAVRRTGDIPEHLQEGLEDAWKEVKNTARVLEADDLAEVARVMRKKVGDHLEKALKSGPSAADLQARALVPRSVKLNEQRALAQARAQGEPPDDDPDRPPV